MLSHRLINALNLHYIHAIMSIVVVLADMSSILPVPSKGFLVTRRYQLYISEKNRFIT